MDKANSTGAGTDESAACECQRYTVEGVGTGCTSTTRGRFAPGHDAKLKGMLIRAGVAGRPVERDGQAADAQAWADNFGFADRVAHGIKLGQEKATAAEQAATAPKTVRIRVGRWTHDALLADDGSASYTTSGGEVKQIEAAKVVLV